MTETTDCGMARARLAFKIGCALVFAGLLVWLWSEIAGSIVTSVGAIMVATALLYGESHLGR